MTDSKELFSASRLLARNRAKYMRSILMAFAPVEAPGLGTIGVTEHGVMMIDWQFIADVEKEEGSVTAAASAVAGLQVHEALHVMLDHLGRAKRGSKDKNLQQMADDLAINDMILAMGLTLPSGKHKGLFPKDFGWPSGETADQYYTRLLKEQQKQPKQGSGGEGEGEAQDDSAGEGDEDSEQGGKPGQGKGGKPRPPKKPHTGGGWCGSCAGKAHPNEPPGTAKESRSKADIDRAVRAVARAVCEESQSSQGRGTVPGFLQRWAEEVLAPAEVPWEQELARVARNAIAWRPNAVDHKYDAPSRKQAGIGYGAGRPILPRYRMPVPEVCVILDTSGSMGSDELGTAGREVNGILKAVGANITFVTCDSQVHGVSKVKTLKEALKAFKGGGGTNMRPALDAVLCMRPRPDVVVCITDLAIGDVGRELPGVKTVWVGVGPYAQGYPAPPWGKTIIVKKNAATK